MKKIPFIIILATISAALFIPLTVQAGNHNNLLAQLTINEDYLPSNAANIPVSKEGQNRAIVGNIILQLVAGSLIYAAGPIAVLMIAIGGLLYVTSHGDQTMMEKAKNTITWAIVGLLIIIVSYAIVTNVIRITSTTGAPPAAQGGAPPAGGAPPPAGQGPMGAPPP